MKRVLSISGGGIRGILPGTIIASIESFTGKPSAQLFDMIAGTSTGGILACGLGAGIPAATMVAMYTQRGPEIFSKKWWRPNVALPKYSDAGINKVLVDVFGARRYHEARTKILVPAFDQKEYTSAHFKSWDCDADLAYFDVARSTSAAPTYFPTYQGRYSDGGVFANDPSMNAYAEARCLWPGEGIRMISLGTGYKPGHAQPPSNGGILEWIKPILSVLMDGPADDIRYMCKVMMGDDHLGIQPVLADYVNAAMDDASPANTAALSRFASAVVVANFASLKTFLAK